ncbi:MAG: rRNA maturation RNase YbeY [Alphaproteobacteria bacterium]|nr:rRNA maturation RNase YbeY [Alphaproteobacteria bacterium]
MTVKFDILQEDDRWNNLPIQAITDQVSAVMIFPDRASEVSVLLTNDAGIQNLNNTYRHKDKTTNVLAFPSCDPAGMLLGDIAMSYDVMQIEAEERGIPLRFHYAHLLTHGLLHLMGYDHIQDDDAQKMEAKEEEILRQLDIPSPYSAE